MKNQFVYAFLFFLLKHKFAYATMWQTQVYAEPDVHLKGFNLESFKVYTIFECYLKCEKNILCLGFKLWLSNKVCRLKYSTKSRHPEKIIPGQTNTVYMEIRDDTGIPGSTSDKPILSCKWWNDIDKQAKSGVYWMKFNEPSSKPFQVFCEMTNDGGGWTLVYSYTFTKYYAFTNGGNAVTPFPNWPLIKPDGTWVEESTITPLSESSHSAMDFALWGKIGNEFLVKSNITNWVACVEGTGSLVNWISGTVSCRVIKVITEKCTNLAPKRFNNRSPGLSGTSAQFYWDGRTSANFPTHDPCASNSADYHVRDVTRPSGALYIR